MWRDWNLCIAGRTIKWWNCGGKWYGNSSKNSCCVYTSKRIESKVSNWYLYAHIHSRITHNSPKVEAMDIRVSNDEWKINKKKYMHTMEYYAAMKGENSDTCRSMDEPWDVMLSKGSQWQRVKNCMILLIWGTYSNQIHKGRKPGVGERGRWEVNV